MPLFNYVAKNQHAETIKGKVEARSSSQAAAILRGRGLLVIAVKEPSDQSFAFISNFLFGIKQDDVVTFTRQLSTMITAGLPLTQSLSILSLQSKPAMGRVVSEIQREIEGGSPFSKALDKFPQVFSRIYVQLVKAGELGGVIDDVLNRLADNMEKDKDFRGKTKGAMIYPAIVIIGLVIVAAIVMIYVVPQLTGMYKDFGAELPFLTKALISISDLFVQLWWIVLIVLVVGGTAFQRWVKTEKGMRAFDKFLFTVPLIGILRAKIILTEYCRTMALLLKAGISLLQALEIVGDATSSVTYRDALKDAGKQIEKGIALSQAISRYEQFPPILQQMISVGEETGKMDEVLFKLSRYFEAESEQAVRNLTAAIEPMIIIVLGIGVGLLVVAVIMPIYNLTAQF